MDGKVYVSSYKFICPHRGVYSLASTAFVPRQAHHAHCVRAARQHLARCRHRRGRRTQRAGAGRRRRQGTGTSRMRTRTRTRT